MKEPTMIRPKPTLYAFAFAIVLAAALPGCATYRKCGFNGCDGDAKITANVKALFDQHPGLESNAIGVETLDHVVYLNGTVNPGIESQTAESIARTAPGVTQVVNSIAVSR
jgi:osmotically-inducible protein OsmY